MLAFENDYDSETENGAKDYFEKNRTIENPAEVYAKVCMLKVLRNDVAI